MKTLVISSSLAKSSRSFILCSYVCEKLKNNNIDVELVDARNMSLVPCHRDITPDMKELTKKIQKADNYVIGMGVHNYSINDALKIILDACFEDTEGKFFGILCSGGGQKSYLSTMHLTQMCMNEWSMIQLPRVVYAVSSDIKEGKIINEHIHERIDLFCKEFTEIGEKLLK